MRKQVYLKKNSSINKKIWSYLKNMPLKIKILLLILVFSFLLFYNLGDQILNGDEFHLALLGKTTLKKGIPYAKTERFLMEPHPGKIDYNKDFIWTYHPWLPFYIQAFSFKMFGESEFSGRILFTLFTFLSLFFIYHIFKFYYKEKAIVPFSFLIFYIPFYLYGRYRYFGLAIFLVSMVLYSYLKLQNKSSKKYWFLFGIGSILLFHTNYFVSLITYSIIWVHLLYTKNKNLIKYMILNNIIHSLFFIPWIIYSEILKKTTGFFSFDSMKIIKIIQFMLNEYNADFPVLILLVGILIFFHNLKIDRNKYSLFIIFFIISTLIMISGKFTTFRNIIGFIPFFIITIYEIYLYLKNKRKLYANLFLILILFTNIFSILPFTALATINYNDLLFEKCMEINAYTDKFNKCEYSVYRNYDNLIRLKFPFFYYLYEISHKWEGYDETGVKLFLEENTKNNETIFTRRYAKLAVFYTNLSYIWNRWTNYSSVPPADWIITFQDDELHKYLNYTNCKYKKYVIDYPTDLKENYPAMHIHKFFRTKIPFHGGDVEIYKKISCPK